VRGLSKNVTNNPHLRGKICAALVTLLRIDKSKANLRASGGIKPQSPLFYPILRHPLSEKHLVGNLIKLYVDIERTGRSSQFYDKFFVRRHITLVLKALRLDDKYKKHVLIESEKQESLFLQFIHLLVNDSIYLLDEVLSKLPVIKQVETEMEDRERWMQKSEETRRDELDRFNQYKREVGVYCFLGNECMILLHQLLHMGVGTFKREEMIDRMGVMLNYQLHHLGGKKKNMLKVKEGEKLHFHPRLLLRLTVKMYLYLYEQNGDRWVDAVVRDGRSFTMNIFHSVVEILKNFKYMIFAPFDELEEEDREGTISAFCDFVAVLEKRAKEVEEPEDIDVPEHFLDPLLNTIMTDPVILPSSQHVVDRATIERHLLSSPTDPFNRSELKPEDLIPNEELKKEIETWMEKNKK